MLAEIFAAGNKFLKTAAKVRIFFHIRSCSL